MSVELRPDIEHEAEEVLQEHDPHVVARKFVESIEASYERYRKELGTGRSGTVWVDHLPLLQHDICVKTLHTPEAAINSLKVEFGLLERFYQAGVRVPKPYGYIDGTESKQFPNGLYLMEAIHGLTLDEILIQRKKENQPFTSDEMMTMVKDLDEQVELANGQNLHHRDLNTRNIMQEPDGRITLIDFGESTAAFGGDSETAIYNVLKERGRNAETVRMSRDRSASARLIEDIRRSGLLPPNAA